MQCESEYHSQCNLGRGIPCGTRGQIQAVMTVSGKCITFKAGKVNRGGMYNGLLMTLDSRDLSSRPHQSMQAPRPAPHLANHISLQTAAFGWSMLLHGRRQSPETASFTHGYYVEGSGMEKVIAATLRTVRVA